MKRLFFLFYGRDNYVKNFFLRRKKDSRQYNSENKNKVECQKLEDKVDRELKKGLKKFHHPNYNDWNFSTWQYVEQLTNYLKKHIIYVYVLAKNANSNIDREIYANTLCSNLCSFIDLYAQILNIFYKLDLKPLRNKFCSTPFDPTSTIIDQAINGDLAQNGSVTTWNSVKNRIKSNYDEQNNYYKLTKKILNDDTDPDIKAIKALRNYCVHYQPLFSRFEIWSNSNQILFNVNSNDSVSDQYQKFIELAYRVIKKEILIIHYFEGMCFDRKMVPKNRHSERVSIFRCNNCNSELMVTDYYKDFLEENCKLKIFCEKCKHNSIIIDTGRTILVHPEKYDSLFVNEYNTVDVIDSSGRSIFEKLDDPNT